MTELDICYNCCLPKVKADLCPECGECSKCCECDSNLIFFGGGAFNDMYGQMYLEDLVEEVLIEESEGVS